jgi:ribosomal protein L20
VPQSSGSIVWPINAVRLQQSYLRVAKHAAMMALRYAHAKQFKRHHRQLRLLRTRALARVSKFQFVHLISEPVDN